MPHVIYLTLLPRLTFIEWLHLMHYLSLPYLTSPYFLPFSTVPNVSWFSLPYHTRVCCCHYASLQREWAGLRWQRSSHWNWTFLAISCCIIVHRLSRENEKSLLRCLEPDFGFDHYASFISFSRIKTYHWWFHTKCRPTLWVLCTCSIPLCVPVSLSLSPSFSSICLWVGFI